MYSINLRQLLNNNAYKCSIRIGLIVGLAFILSLGPHLQTYFTALLSSDAPSIYGSAYQDSIVRFPNIRTWMIESLWWPFWLGAIMITLLSIRNNSARNVLAFGTMSSWAFLMTLDVIMSIINKTISIDYILSNIILNSIGGFIIAFILLLILYATDIFHKYSPTSRLSRMAVSIIIPSSIGIILSMATYYVIVLLYKPVPAQIDLIVDHPSSGAISGGLAKGKENITKTKDEKRFALVQDVATTGSASWTDADGPLNIKWEADNGKKLFKATFEFYSGCMKVGQITERIKPIDAFTITPIHKMDVSFGSGYSEFAVVSSEKETSKYSLKTENESVRLFSTYKGDNADSLSIDQYVGDNSNLIVSNNRKSIQYYFLTALMDSNGDAASLASRTLRIDTDRGDYLIPIKSSVQSGVNKIEKCRSITSTKTFIGTGSPTAVDALSFGIIVRIEQISDVLLFEKNESKLTVSGDSGRVVVNLNKDALTRTSEGNIDMLMIYSNISDLDIDGATRQIRPHESVTIFGELKGRYDDGGKLRFSGAADAIWVNQVRANKTRWEALELDVWTVVYPLGASLLFLLAFCSKMIRDDRRFRCVSSEGCRESAKSNIAN